MSQREWPWGQWWGHQGRKSEGREEAGGPASNLGEPGGESSHCVWASRSWVCAHGLIPRPRDIGVEVRCYCLPCAEADVEGEKDASPAEQAGGRGRPAGTGFRKERLQLVEGLSPHPPLRAPWETAGVAHLSAPGRLAWVTHPIPGHTLRRAGKVKHTSGPLKM